MIEKYYLGYCAKPIACVSRLFDELLAYGFLMVSKTLAASRFVLDLDPFGLSIMRSTTLLISRLLELLKTTNVRRVFLLRLPIWSLDYAKHYSANLEAPRAFKDNDRTESVLIKITYLISRLYDALLC
jgi:hypothetical protein